MGLGTWGDVYNSVQVYYRFKTCADLINGFTINLSSFNGLNSFINSGATS